MNEYVRTDTTEDLLATLELSREFLAKAYSDDRYWKWFIYSIHSAAQSTAALALENGNGFLVQKPGVMLSMLEAYENGAPPVSPHMDNFSRLIERAFIKQNLRCSAEPLQDNGHTKALESLDELRDGFAHFNVKSWSIEILLILECASKVLGFVHHYACTTPAILWNDKQDQQRAALAIGSLKSELENRASKPKLSSVVRPN